MHNLGTMSMLIAGLDQCSLSSAVTTSADSSSKNRERKNPTRLTEARLRNSWGQLQQEITASECHAEDARATPPPSEFSDDDNAKPAAGNYN